MTLSATLAEPAFRSVPAFRDTLGPEVAELAALAGFPPDPEQELALDAMFAFGADGRISAFEFAVIAPRQNLKTGLFKQAALGWLFVTEQRLIVWSAHEMKTTKEAFNELASLIENCPALSKRLAAGPSNGIHRGNGDEAIELASGQRVMFKARTNGGGRGLTGDKVILDEAFALKPSHMGSLLPTLSARPDPQVVYGSSAGLADSDVLRSIRDRGRPGDDPSLAYFEWCDDLPGECQSQQCAHRPGTDGCILDDPLRVARANPQAGKRITWEYLRAERRALAAMPLEYWRERLGRWDDPSLMGTVVPAAMWEKALDPDSGIVSRPSFALDTAPDRSWSAIAAAGLNAAGRFHLEITSRDGLMDYREGTGWLMPRLGQLREAFPDMRLNIAAGSGAESLKPEIEVLMPVDVMPITEVAAGCGSFYDLATSTPPGLAHLGQKQLTDALISAKKRVEDGETAWVWGRKRSGGNITSLYAATVALRAAYQLHIGDYDLLDSIL